MALLVGPTFSESALGTASWAATTTFDLSKVATYLVTLAGTTTLAVTNDVANPRFTLILNTGTGGFAVTWFAGIRWAGGTVPTVTTTASKYDVYTFIRVAAGTYLGFVASQAM